MTPFSNINAFFHQSILVSSGNLLEDGLLFFLSINTKNGAIFGSGCKLQSGLEVIKLNSAVLREDDIIETIWFSGLGLLFSGCVDLSEIF